MSKLRTVAAALAAAAALTLSACATSAPAPAQTGSSNEPTFIAGGKLTVCTHLAFKPFQFKDDTGAIVGFDVDLMDLVAEDLGRTQEIVDIAFDQVWSGAAFAAGKCDAGAAAISITDARKKSTTFADPYFESTLALMVKTGSGIKGLEDLRGKTVAVQTDTTGATFAEQKASEYGFETKVFDDMPTASSSVLGTGADATINDNGVLLSFANDNPSVTVATEFADTGEWYGFNVSNDNKPLADEISRVLRESKADGRFNEIYKKWFGVDAPK
ncbi:MAG: transporter substrate-binding domain-containing protein [Nigerium sp.]|nr:transporter substrate-binding domain-containing protein [Nigerium sp.]